MIQFKQGDCLQLIKEIPDSSVNCILTDPPYKYLKNQKLETDFDESTFFNEVKRVLKPEGFIVLFGRGTSFYRWNYMLSELGFSFKEEIVWDKSYSTSPLMAISRVHETISINSKGKGSINKVKIPYLEMKNGDISGIIRDIKRLKTTFKNAKSLQAVEDYLANNLQYESCSRDKSTTIQSANLANIDRCAAVMSIMDKGMNEKSIIRTDRYSAETFTKYGATCDKREKGNRCVDVLNSLEIGMNEKTIIREIRDHYSAIHPTQKPVRLIERLLALTTKEGDIVLDPFAGSCSTGVACANTKRKFIGYELDSEYFEKAKERLNSLELTLFNTL